MSGNTFEARQTRLPHAEFLTARLVPQVLSVLNEGGYNRGDAAIPVVLELLVSSMLSGDATEMAMLKAECRRRRIPSGALIETYIPAAADRIGAQWHDDELDILSATITFARMQTFVRELGRGWNADSQRNGCGSVLMLVPESEQHTLGAMVATAMLRRRGVSVTVKLTSSTAELAMALASTRFHGVFVSASNECSLEISARLVKNVKALGRPSIPVVVGGAVPATAEQIIEVTGADLATRSIEAALCHIGLGGHAKSTW